ncbi:hypothetical protein GCK72_006787 [Caenorhabditis remanei]|uniref:C2H2-type domain-containing protein n=1 Tax=Caenorhabditis remanei TaxID=31234 RepID=A0A6A5HHI9_CAERE|nr:hypothetical protein GCK72_006787 [Caenorhabditis remanei]KAF1766829.1 hypothetical protein GCK72_006787 [Caenorhabditis remanei]
MGKRKRFTVPTVNGEYSVDDLFRSKPKFAVINLEDNKNSDPFDLAKNLFNQGFPTVQFYDSLAQMNGQPVGGQVNDTLLSVLTKVLVPKKSNNDCDVIQINPMPTSPTPTNPYVQDPAHATQISASLPIPHVLPHANHDPTRLLSSLLTAATQNYSNGTLCTNQARLRDNRKEAPIPEEYLPCTKCGDRLQITETPQLVKHVNRHFNISEYQCPVCLFMNDSSHVMRKHLKYMHGEKNPVAMKSPEMSSSEMQKLLEEHFPGRDAQMKKVREARSRENSVARFSTSGLNSYSASAIDSVSESVSQATDTKRNKKNNQIPPIFPTTIPNPFLMQPQQTIQEILRMLQATPAPLSAPQVQQPKKMKVYHCSYCPKLVECDPGTELRSDGQLAQHLRTQHARDCVVYKCGECSYKHETQWKVRRHITIRHFMVAEKTDVVESRRPAWKLFLRKFFYQLEVYGVIKECAEDLECGKLEKDMDRWKKMIEAKQQMFSSTSEPTAKKKRVDEESKESVITIE